MIIRTDKSVFFKSMLRYVKRVTHWKPTQKFKFKLVNIFKSYSHHNRQVYFRNNFCFISSELYFIFTTQWLICEPLYTVRFTIPYWFSYSINPLLTYNFILISEMVSMVRVYLYFYLSIYLSIYLSREDGPVLQGGAGAGECHHYVQLSIYL